MALARRQPRDAGREIELARDAAARAGALVVFEDLLESLTEGTEVGGQPLAKSLRVRLLDAFELSSPDGPVDMSSLRPIHRMLFATLCIDCGEWTHRDRLVESVWPGSDPARSGHNLQVALSAIRRLLSQVGYERALLRNGDRYRLDATCVSTDVRDLERHLRTATNSQELSEAQSNLERALALFGELLPERGASDWVVTQRRDLATAVGRCSSKIARATAEVDLRRAAAIARRAIDIDPYSDDLWRTAIDASERCGDAVQAAVLRSSYEHLVSTLDGL